MLDTRHLTLVPRPPTWENASTMGVGGPNSSLSEPRLLKVRVGQSHQLNSFLDIPLPNVLHTV